MNEWSIKYFIGWLNDFIEWLNANLIKKHLELGWLLNTCEDEIPAAVVLGEVVDEKAYLSHLAQIRHSVGGIQKISGTQTPFSFSTQYCLLVFFLNLHLHLTNICVSCSFTQPADSDSILLKIFVDDEDSRGWDRFKTENDSCGKREPTRFIVVNSIINTYRNKLLTDLIFKKKAFWLK